MDEIDRRVVDALQRGFPVCERPFDAAAAELGLSESDLIARIGRLLDAGTLTRFGPLFQVERMGGSLTLAAMAVPEDRFDAVAAQVNALPAVAHNYRREHALNMWFVLAGETPEQLAQALRSIAQATGLPVMALPKEREYFLGLELPARA
jgi:DNA-binding Lrp family transcriptional regulator